MDTELLEKREMSVERIRYVPVYTCADQECLYKREEILCFSPQFTIHTSLIDTHISTSFNSSLTHTTSCPEDPSLLPLLARAISPAAVARYSKEMIGTLVKRPDADMSTRTISEP